MSTLTNDLARLANSANVLVSAIAVNTSAITSVNVSGLIINSSGFGGPATFSNNVTINGNLVVSGTTVTVNTQTLDVKDLNITVAKGAASAAAANGAGITVDSGYANLFYSSSANAWTTTVGLNVAGGNVGIGTSSPGSKLHIEQTGISTTTTVMNTVTEANAVAATIFDFDQYTTVDGGGSSMLRFRKANGTKASPTVVGANRATGRVGSQIYDGAAFYDNGLILFSADGTPATGSTPGRIQFYTTASGSTTVAERMRIDNAGGVGIGTTSPSAKLHITSSTNDGIKLTDGTVTSILYNSSSLYCALGTQSNHGFDLYTNNTIRTRTNAGGDTQFGVSPTAAGGLRYLDVYNTESSNTGSGAIIRLVTANSTGGAAVTLDMVKYRFGQFTLNNNDANGFITFNTAGSERVRIDNSGNIGVALIPSAWNSSRRAIQFGAGGSLNASVGSTTFTEWGANFYTDSAANDIYIGTAAASKYRQFNSAHSWYFSASNTAGSIITWTQAMTLNSSGNLGIGTTSPESRLHVANEIRVGRTDASSEGGEIKLCRSIDDVAAYSIDVNGNTTNPEFRIFNPIAGTVFFAASNTGVRYLKFDPTAANIGDANCLDDYEEGTWTPRIDSNNGQGTFTTKSGYYIKIGRKVTAWFLCDFGNSLAAGTTQYLTGLPFSIYSSYSGTSCVGQMGTNGPATRTQQLMTLSANRGVAYVYIGGSQETTTITYATGVLEYLTD